MSLLPELEKEDWTGGIGIYLIMAKRSFGQGFQNWLKISHMVQQGPHTLITNYCACTSNRNKFVDNQKLIRSSKVGAYAVAHLPLPLPVRFRSAAHHTDKLLMPQ